MGYRNKFDLSARIAEVAALKTLEAAFGGNVYDYLLRRASVQLVNSWGDEAHYRVSFPGWGQNRMVARVSLRAIDGRWANGRVILEMTPRTVPWVADITVGWMQHAPTVDLFGEVRNGL